MMLLGLFTPADVQKSTFSDDRPQEAIVIGGSVAMAHLDTKVGCCSLDS